MRGCARGRDFGDEEEEAEAEADEMAEMVRGSRAAPICDLARSGSNRSAGKGAGVGADAIFYPSAGRRVESSDATPVVHRGALHRAMVRTEVVKSPRWPKWL